MAKERNQEKKVSAKKPVIRANVSNEVGNYEKHPFFVKKTNDAKEFLQMVGLPTPLVRKS